MSVRVLDKFGPWQRHFVRSQIARELRRAGAEAVEVRLIFKDEGLPPKDVQIERSGKTYVVSLQNQPKEWHRRVAQKLATAIFWLSNCPPHIRSITLNVSDGDVFSEASFAYSVRTDWQSPIPDPHFFHNLGYEAQRRAGFAAPAWQERSDALVWRGGLNGRGWASFDPDDRFDSRVIQRLRLVQIGRTLDDADIALNSIPLEHRCYVHFARKQRLLTRGLPENSWMNSKFAIDIDGYTNTWSNLLVRMLYGCCVLKIDSHFGYRQWYYPHLRPYEHYIPVSADMRDLERQLEWARSNPKDSAAIARAGQGLARSLTFASQTRRAAEIIEGGPLQRPCLFRPEPQVV